MAMDKHYIALSEKDYYFYQPYTAFRFSGASQPSFRNFKPDQLNKPSAMKKLIFALGIAVLAFSCESRAQKAPIPTYNFPEQTIISKAAADCIEDPSDVLIGLFGEIDKGFLSVYEVSPSEEKEVGEMIHSQLEYRYIEDKRAKKLRNILSQMKPYIERKEIPYQVYLIDDGQINAWTIPGGNIYVTTAMYDFVANDDELANVIGHEIGHSENKHTVKPIQREKQKQDITNVTGLDVGLFVDLYSFATIAYNQPQEIEADYSGFYLSYKAGYNPELGLEFWRRMAERENPHMLEKLFRSHPYSKTRYQCGKEYLQKARFD